MLTAMGMWAVKIRENLKHSADHLLQINKVKRAFRTMGKINEEHAEAGRYFIP